MKRASRDVLAIIVVVFAAALSVSLRGCGDMDAADTAAEESSTTIADAISTTTEDPVYSLILALGDEDVNVRIQAVHALGTVRGSRAVSALITALQDEETGVRDAARAALLVIGPNPTEAALQLLGDQSRYTADQRTEALGSLLAVFSDENIDASTRAAFARDLGTIGDPRALEALAAALQDENAEVAVRCSAAEALVMIGGPRALEALVAALQDDNAHASVRCSAAEALGKIEDLRALDALITSLKDDHNADVRKSCVQALGALGDLRALDALITALKDDRNADVRNGSALVLAELGSPRAVDAMVDALETTTVVYVVAEYLIRMGRPDTEQTLVDLLDSHGDKDLAQLFLNCENAVLSSAASEWATANGYFVVSGAGPSVLWGQN